MTLSSENIKSGPQGPLFLNIARDFSHVISPTTCEYTFLQLNSRYSIKTTPDTVSNRV
jgi:hypothetical protein